MRSAPVQQRGVALILVLTTIAILTSIGVDFSYSSRVSLKLAENLRDEARAEYRRLVEGPKTPPAVRDAARQRLAALAQ